MQKILIASSSITSELAETLIKILGTDSGIYISTERIVQQINDGVDFCISVVTGKTCIKDDKAILLLPRDSELPVVESPLTIVADSARQHWPANFGGHIISCGSSRKDTLTFSSKTHEGAVVALMRQIMSLGGQIIEPCEYPVAYIEKDPFIILATVGLLLLTERIGIFGENHSEARYLQL